MPLLQRASIALLAALPFCTAQGGGKSVNAALTSAWASTPLELEASEFLSNLDSEYFWMLVELTRENGGTLGELSDKARHDSIVELTKARLGQFSSNLLGLSLATREYSPAIAMHRQLAKSAWTGGNPGKPMPCAFATVNNVVVDGLGPLQQALKTCSPESASATFDFDHVYPVESKAGVPVITVYGKIGTAQLSELHTAAKALSVDGKASYVLRHSDCGCSPDACSDSNKFHLQGYGVELAVKNVENKTKDDKEVSQEEEKTGAAAAEDDESGEDVEVEGVLFKTLIKRRPELKSELQNFRDVLLASSSFDEPLKVNCRDASGRQPLAGCA